MKPENQIQDQSHVKMNGLERDVLHLLRYVFGKRTEIKLQAPLFGRPDYFVPSLNLCIFADGSYFHDSRLGMTRYGLRQLASGDKEKGQFYVDKGAQNRARDRTVNKELRRLGYQVVRLKEERIRNSKDPLGYVSRCLSEAFRSKVAAAHPGND